MRRADPSLARQAVILCGGIGSRLGDLTRSTIKPLLPVGGTPFLERLLLEVARFGIERILFLAAHRSGDVEAFAAATCPRLGLRYAVAVEPDRAGTGGALWHARDRLDPVFFLFNGDSWFDINILDLARRLGEDDDVAMALRHVDDAARYGAVAFADGRVRRFEEKTGDARPGLVNGGVYVARDTLVTQLSPSCSLERDGLAPLASRGRVAGARYEGFFIDIGVPEDFARAQVAVPAARTRGAVFLDRDGVLNEDRGHVGEIERFHWLPGAREGIKAINDRNLFAFVVTNQAGVARGFYDEASVARLHAHMQAELRMIGAHIDAFRYCPFHPEGVVAAYRKASDWRKPAPGMILDLLATWPVNEGASLMIGDRDGDVEAARAAGIDGWKIGDGVTLAQALARALAIGRSSDGPRALLQPLGGDDRDAGHGDHGGPAHTRRIEGTT